MGAGDDEETATAATVAPPNRAPRVTAPTTGGGSSSTTITSPLEALERDEILRTRRFCIIASLLSIAGAATVPLLPGDPVASKLLLGAVGAALVAIAFLWTRTSDPIRFRHPSTSLGWFVPAACVTTAIPFFGAFSPAPVVLVLGIYFTGLGKNSRLAFAVYATCAGAQAMISAMIIGGWGRDTGLVRVVGLGTRERIAIQLLVQLVLLATLIIARISRRTALLALGELERAVRVSGHREALLLEARVELERALKSGRGRFTDQAIGSYRLGQVIGRGAMGEVYEAVTVGGDPVAIKLLGSTSLSNPNHVLRFLRELRTAMGIVAPNIVRVIEVGENPVPYLVMEKLEGKNLGDILKQKRSLLPAEVVELIRQIGAGITAAAAAGVVHRDLKPHNVFNHRGTWKILDFGVARAIDAGDTLTEGQIVGTPSYMAPEQASGGTVDHATDLYALAAVAYRALTGHPVFASGEIAETLYRVVHTAPVAPSTLIDAPFELDLVMAIGLAKKPRDRFTSAHDFAEALADAFTGALPPALRERGEQLVRAGAWKAARPSTTRLR